MIFDKLSPTTDFISKIQSSLDILNGNVLYITHEVDKIKKVVTRIDLESHLQHQVDEYFEDRAHKDEEKEPE